MATVPTSFTDTGNAGMRGDDDVADVLERLHLAEAAHVVELAALRVEAAAGVGVVVGELLHDLRHGDAVRHEPVRIDLHLVLHRLAAEAGVVGDALDRAIAPLEHPVLEDLELLRRAVRALQHVAVDQAAGAEERRHAGRHAGRHLRVRRSARTPARARSTDRCRTRSSS